ncbi:hypothetical protein [Kribbella jiaozuonensis]|uniref:Uncharacterized protein n=1 Tax=Kribbella jiaozuonensis TaxID=2575441 RepID=A0A4U3LVI9_9ACTN|nr:hypothetical protein [Kribbella jiaozuonensis]TKK80131.1 hypothetical protein FDA38_17500 [Kribbella jiaozuonensis]
MRRVVSWQSLVGDYLGRLFVWLVCALIAGLLPFFVSFWVLEDWREALWRGDLLILTIAIVGSAGRDLWLSKGVGALPLTLEIGAIVVVFLFSAILFPLSLMNDLAQLSHTPLPARHLTKDAVLEYSEWLFVSSVLISLCVLYSTRETRRSGAVNKSKFRLGEER